MEGGRGSDCRTGEPGRTCGGSDCCRFTSSRTLKKGVKTSRRPTDRFLRQKVGGKSSPSGPWLYTGHPTSLPCSLRRPDSTIVLPRPVGPGKRGGTTGLLSTLPASFSSVEPVSTFDTQLLSSLCPPFLGPEVTPRRCWGDPTDWGDPTVFGGPDGCEGTPVDGRQVTRIKTVTGLGCRVEWGCRKE